VQAANDAEVMTVLGNRAAKPLPPETDIGTALRNALGDPAVPPITRPGGTPDLTVGTIMTRNAPNQLQILTPANILDIHHALVLQAKPRVGGDPVAQMQATRLKQWWSQFADAMLQGHKPLRADYARFKMMMEAQDLGTQLPLLGGERSAAAQFLAKVERDRLIARTRALRFPSATDARKAAEAADDVLEAFRRSWGETLKEQIARATNPNQLAQFVDQALTPAGRARIGSIMGDEAAEFVQELTLLAARNHGLALGRARGGSDSATMQFLGRLLRERNTAALDEFRRAWGSRLRDDLAAAESPAAVNSIIRSLISPEGKRRILNVLGDVRGREFIESLYNKATQSRLGNWLYGNSDTAYKLQEIESQKALSDVGTVRGILNAIRHLATEAMRQRRADQANMMLSRQGPAQVGPMLDSILARQQLRTTGHPYLVRPALPAIGPGASYLPTTYERRRP
jgi:hypothetical protein